LPELLDAIPQEALECAFLQPGAADKFKDGWVHVKTVPYVVLAQTLVGCYEVESGGERAKAGPGEAFLVEANRKMAITHHCDPKRGGQMASRWLHGRWTLFGTVDFGSLLDLPLKLDARLAKPFGGIIAELLAGDKADGAGEGKGGAGGRGGLAGLARRKELAFQALRLLCELAPPRPEAEELLRSSERLSPVTAYIRAHLADPLDVEALARAAFLSGSRLHALFQQHLKRSPMAYVREMRLNEARRLLATTAMSVGQVAAATGFANQFHFSRAFRSAAGQTPTAYRRAHADLLV
jgi:AraC-like DNA-binding protein